MASFSVEEFLGNGVLKDLIPMLFEEGWDDVPTLKVMNSADTIALNMSKRQKDALEIRSHLHDRSLMQYADRLETSDKSLSELLNSSPTVLSSQFGMKRGHVARFVNRGTACGMPMSSSLRRKKSSSGGESETGRELFSINSTKLQNIGSMNKGLRSPGRGNAYYDASVEVPLGETKIKEGYVFKGIVALEPAKRRFFGLVKPPLVADQVAPYSMIDNISVQKLSPEYKIGIEPMKLKTPPMKASELWHDKPAVLLCLRRPGCIMCRAEAHQLYMRKPLFDAMGFQLIAVLHEQIDSEIKEFWPRYWGGIVILDKGRDFFKALGGGKLMKESFMMGFIFNRRARANYKRAKATGFQHNYTGEGEIKGGLFIIGSGKSGISYQFMERNFGDWAPLGEVVEICSQMQKQQLGRGESFKPLQGLE